MKYSVTKCHVLCRLSSCIAFVLTEKSKMEVPESTNCRTGLKAELLREKIEFGVDFKKLKYVLLVLKCDNFGFDIIMIRCF